MFLVIGKFELNFSFWFRTLPCVTSNFTERRGVNLFWYLICNNLSDKYNCTILPVELYEYIILFINHL